MRKYGKKYQEAQKLVEVGKTYTILEAAELIKKVATTKFDATVTVQFNLGLDVKQADQQLRGAFVLPNGTGKTRKVLAITNKIEEAKAAEEAKKVEATEEAAAEVKEEVKAEPVEEKKDDKKDAE